MKLTSWLHSVTMTRRVICPSLPTATLVALLGSVLPFLPPFLTPLGFLFFSYHLLL